MGAVGNQYARFSEIMASGMATDSPEWQIFTHARPGTVDTSAVPERPGAQPGHHERDLQHERRARPSPTRRSPKWRKAASLRRRRARRHRAGASPGETGKCWKRSVQKEAVHHILKGGEDSIGLDGSRPARLLQHRLLLRGVLGQPPDRLPADRSAAAQLRPDPVRHRPVPARLPELPRHRGPAGRRRGLPAVDGGAPSRPRGRAEEGPGRTSSTG